MEKILLSVCSNHIKGYGYASDLIGETVWYGLDKEIVTQYIADGYTLREEFIQNSSLPCHIPFHGDSLLKIPRGTLLVWAEK